MREERREGERAEVGEAEEVGVREGWGSEVGDWDWEEAVMELADSEASMW